MKPEEAKEYLRTQFADQLELVELYIEDVDFNQDVMYWTEFNSLSQLATDFQLFVRTLEE